jgi:predicted exporter
MSLDQIADIAGFVGALVILSGFGYQTLRNAKPDRLYHLANFVGAGLLAVSLTIHYNLPALCLEVAWATIALVGLLRSVVSRA